MKTSHKIGLGTAAGLVGIGSLLGVSLANADSNDASSPTASPSTNSDRRQMPPEDRGSKHDDRTEDRLAAQLAERLGLDQTKVKQAIQAAHQATRPAQNGQPQSTPPNTPDETDRATREDAFLTELANQLGIDKETLSQAVAEIRESADAGRKSEFQTRLDDAVSAGTLTREEANAVLKAAEAGVIDYGGGPR